MSWKDLPQHLHLFQPESEGKALQIGLMKGMMGLGRVGGGRAAVVASAATVSAAAAGVPTAAAVVNGGGGDERKAGGGMEVSDRVRDLLSDKGSKSGRKKDKDKDKDRDRDKSKKDKQRNKEDKKRQRSNDNSSPTPPPTTDTQPTAPKRPKLTTSTSSSSLLTASTTSPTAAHPLPPPPLPPHPPLPPTPNIAELSTTHDTWKRSTDGMMEQLRGLREGRASGMDEMRRRKEETERLMREREEDEVKIREMRRAVEAERAKFDTEKRARKQLDDEEDELMRAVWKEEEWYMDMNVMRRKIVQLLLQQPDPLRVDEERVVELVALGCQQYVKGVVEELVRVKSRRREEEKERWQREGRVVEGVDGLEEVRRRERSRVIEVERVLKQRTKQQRRQLIAEGLLDDDDAAMDDGDSRTDAMDDSNAPPLPPPPPAAPSRSRADDANKLTVADLMFVMERDGRLKRSERMWTMGGRVGLRIKDWPPQWQPPAQSVQSTYVDVSQYNVANNAASSSSSSLPAADADSALASDAVTESAVPAAAGDAVESALLSPAFSEPATAASDVLTSPFTPAVTLPSTGAADGDVGVQDESSSQQTLALSQPSRQSSAASLASQASATSAASAASYPANTTSSPASPSVVNDTVVGVLPSLESQSLDSQLHSSPPAVVSSSSLDAGGDATFAGGDAVMSEANADADLASAGAADEVPIADPTAIATHAAGDGGGDGGELGADEDLEAEMLRQFNE